MPKTKKEKQLGALDRLRRMLANCEAHDTKPDSRELQWRERCRREIATLEERTR